VAFIVLIRPSLLCWSCSGVDQPGFTRGCNYLLPVDITVKLDRAAATDSLSLAKKGQKLRKPAAKGITFRRLLTASFLWVLSINNRKDNWSVIKPNSHRPPNVVIWKR